MDGIASEEEDATRQQLLPVRVAATAAAGHGSSMVTYVALSCESSAAGGSAVITSAGNDARIRWWQFSCESTGDSQLAADAGDASSPRLQPVPAPSASNLSMVAAQKTKHISCPEGLQGVRGHTGGKPTLVYGFQVRCCHTVRVAVSAFWLELQRLGHRKALWLVIVSIFRMGMSVQPPAGTNSCEGPKGALGMEGKWKSDSDATEGGEAERSEGDVSMSDDRFIERSQGQGGESRRPEEFEAGRSLGSLTQRIHLCHNALDS